MEATKQLLAEIELAESEHKEALDFFEQYSKAKPGDSAYDSIFAEMQDERDTRDELKRLVRDCECPSPSSRCARALRMLCTNAVQGMGAASNGSRGYADRTES